MFSSCNLEQPLSFTEIHSIIRPTDLQTALTSFEIFVKKTNEIGESTDAQIASSRDDNLVKPEYTRCMVESFVATIGIMVASESE